MIRNTFLFILIVIITTLSAQEPFDGYTLYGPNGSHNTYLLDMNGDNIHTWNSSNSGGYSSYLLEDGTLLRPVSTNTFMSGAASSGRFEKLDWNGNITWQFEYHGNNYLPHHDIEPLPNGNILIVSWEVKSGTEAVANGRSSYVTMWPDYIVEVEPDGSNGGNIVWEWHFWDHLIQDHDPTKANYGVVEDHPELLDINLGNLGGGPGGGDGDWLHINGIDYNPELDQIVMSSHNMDEIYVIDHSTTTQEAAGHTGGNSGMGGDILYRWGYPSNYGASGSYNISVVHCAYWVPADCPGAGNLMAFNNGSGTNQSKVFEITPPYENTYNYSWTSGTAYAPDQPEWQYTNGYSFYSNHLGSVQRLPNGNTLIAESTSGYMFEVDTNSNIVWDKDTSYEVSRCLRYATDYPGLSQLFPSGEINGTVLDGSTSNPVEGAIVTLDSYSATTNASGYYELELPEGTYELTCTHENYEEYTHSNDVIITENQTTTVDLSMTPLAVPGTVTGTIINNTTLDPVHDATIYLGEYETQSDENGLYLLDVPPGTYQLSCEHPAYEIYYHSEDIIVEEGQIYTINFSMVPLELTGTITGSIINIQNSYPVENAVISFNDYQTTSNSSGYFEMELPVGMFLVTVAHPDYQTYTYPDSVEIETNVVSEIEIQLTPLVGVNNNVISTKNNLLGNYPNPFNPTTTIRFQLSDSSKDAKLYIFNLKGEKIRQFPISNSQTSIIWDGTDQNGKIATSGIYFYQLRSARWSATKKMILLK